MVTAAAISLLAMTVLIGILTNKSDINGLRTQMDSLRSQLDGVKDANHKDALEIMRAMTALHERVAVVESKVGG